jgi:hypothetical protein
LSSCSLSRCCRMQSANMVASVVDFHGGPDVCIMAVVRGLASFSHIELAGDGQLQTGSVRFLFGVTPATFRWSPRPHFYRVGRGGGRLSLPRLHVYANSDISPQPCCMSWYVRNSVDVLTPLLRLGRPMQRTKIGRSLPPQRHAKVLHQFLQLFIVQMLASRQS